MIPTIIITRDRVTYTKQCIESLMPFAGPNTYSLDLHYSYGLDLFIVDHGSTWPEMVEFLDTTSIPTFRFGDAGPRDLWDNPILEKIVGDNQPYIVTDPDVILDENIPDDWAYELIQQLHEHWIVHKVGLGLSLTDLPPGIRTEEVIAWEQGLIGETVPNNRPDYSLLAAPIDTTFALYRPLSEVSRFTLGPALRTSAPYLLRHLPWYASEEDENSPELSYYRSHILPGSSHWTDFGRRS